MRGQSSYDEGDYVRHVKVEQRDRFYEIHVPASYSKSKAFPMVLVFHGGGGNPTAIRWQSKMDDAADKFGFIAVYPAGTGYFKRFALTYNAIGCCGYAFYNNVDDVGFVRVLLDDITKFFCVDPKRIYATGYSNGAQLTYLLACKLSDRIAAIAPIAAPMTLENSLSTRPVSVMHFHGLKDRAVHFDGGIGDKGIEKTGFSHMSVEKNIRFWVSHNGCPKSPAKEWRIGKAVFTLYGPGREDTEVILCKVEDGGHTWPGGDVATSKENRTMGHVNKDISASELMWEFFARHPMK